MAEIQRRSVKPSLGSRVLRAITWAFWIGGAVADLLGIYAFGELHDWWNGWKLPLIAGLSPQVQYELWMVAFAISYPWTMTVAAVLTLTVLRPVIRDRNMFELGIQSLVRVGFCYAIFNLSKMVWGGRIKDEYMNASSALNVNGKYLIAGVALGLVTCVVSLVAKHYASKTARQGLLVPASKASSRHFQ